MEKVTIVLVFLFYYINYGLTQITTEYVEKTGSWMHRHRYTFEKQDSLALNGTFNDLTWYDDGGRWLGRGTFVETKHFFILTYNLPPYSDTILYRYNPKHPNNTIGLQWMNFWGEFNDEEIFIEVFDSLRPNERAVYDVSKNYTHSVFIMPADSSLFCCKIIYSGILYEKLSGLNIPNGMNDIIVIRNIEGYRLIYHDQPIKLRKLRGGRLEDEKGHIFIKVKKK